MFDRGELPVNLGVRTRPALPRVLSVCWERLARRIAEFGSRSSHITPAIPLEGTNERSSHPRTGRWPRAQPRRAQPCAPSEHETKASFKTTEFFAFLVVLAGILISAGVVDEANNGGLGARQAWLYATILTVGYMVSRGLAKAGSRQPYDEDRS